MKAPKKKSDKNKRPRKDRAEGAKEATKPLLMEPTESRKRKMRESIDTHKDSLKARKFVAMDEFGAGEPFEVLKEEGGLLKCMPCGGKLVKFKRKADVRQHFEGARSKEKKSKVGVLSHSENMETARKKQEDANALEKVVALNAQSMWASLTKTSRARLCR